MVRLADRSARPYSAALFIMLYKKNSCKIRNYIIFYFSKLKIWVFKFPFQWIDLSFSYIIVFVLSFPNDNIGPSQQQAIFENFYYFVFSYLFLSLFSVAFPFSWKLVRCLEAGCEQLSGRDVKAGYRDHFKALSQYSPWKTTKYHEKIGKSSRSLNWKWKEGFSQQGRGISTSLPQIFIIFVRIKMYSGDSSELLADYKNGVQN